MISYLLYSSRNVSLCRSSTNQFRTSFDFTSPFFVPSLPSVSRHQTVIPSYTHTHTHTHHIHRHRTGAHIYISTRTFSAADHVSQKHFQQIMGSVFPEDNSSLKPSVRRNPRREVCRSHIPHLRPSRRCHSHHSPSPDRLRTWVPRWRAGRKKRTSGMGGGAAEYPATGSGGGAEGEEQKGRGGEAA